MDLHWNRDWPWRQQPAAGWDRDRRRDRPWVREEGMSFPWGLATPGIGTRIEAGTDTGMETPDQLVWG